LAAGVIFGIATVTCLAMNLIDGRHAVAMALPSVLLIACGLTAAAIPDPRQAWRHGRRAGYLAGLLLNRWRSLLRRGQE
jgi:hypothetical protein